MKFKAIGKLDLIQCLIVGATAGFFSAGIAIAARFTTDPGDILGFIGGAVGAGFAVAGAIYVETRSRANRAAEQHEPFFDLIMTVRSELRSLRDPEPSVYPFSDIRGSINTLKVSAALLRNTPVASHLKMMKEIIAVNQLSERLTDVVKKFGSRKWDKLQISEVDAAQQALALIWYDLGDVLFAADRVADLLGHIYSAEEPWGWLTEIPTIIRIPICPH